MARLIPLTDSKKRDAQVAAAGPVRRKPVRMVAPTSALVHLERLIRGTDATSYEALLRAHGSPEAVAKAIVAGDPEVPLSVLGRRLGEAARVYVRQDGTLLTSARLVQVVRGPDGAEKSRAEFVDVEANVIEEGPALPWTGRLVPIEEAARKFAFGRALQLRHVSGLTFEFLLEMARMLAKEKKLLQVGVGPKGQQPLILQTNGAPYRGFLEGRAEGEKYLLVLHLTNLELKRPEAAS